MTVRIKHQLVSGLYFQNKPNAWELRGRLTESKVKLYRNKPKQYNAELFELVPLYEVHIIDE